jgi:SNF2 family DNA or RNA helicase
VCEFVPSETKDVFRSVSFFFFRGDDVKILENKALLLNLRNPERVSTVIPNSKLLGNGNVLVKWGLDEAQVLKNLRIKNVPSPILGQYGWPGTYQPFNHQKETAAFLTLNKRAFCLSEQGTGKTGGVIWAADYLLATHKICRVLVICPLSIMQSAWQADLFKIAMHRSVDVAHGSGTKRRAIIAGDAEFVIINYDGVEIVEKEIAAGGFDLIVVDEANAYKTSTTKRWKCLNRLVKPETWLWMMTGTPAAQSPVDAYGLAKLVNPMGVPRYFTSFKDMVLYRVTQHRWMPKPNAEQVVFAALQPAIRHTKKECSDLPDMTYVSRDVELTPQQKKFYDTLKKRLVVQAAGEEVTAVNAAVGLNKLLQISCGAVYSDTGEVLMFDIKNRYKVLREVIDETKHKVLIFAPYKHMIDVLSKSLDEDGFTVEVIRGDVSAGKRTDIFRRFQETPDPRILVIQPQAAAHGVTLTAADTVVWWGPTSSLEIYAQANARAHRTGQKNPVTIVRLQGSAAERHLYKLLDSRDKDHVKLVDLYKTLLE